MFCCDFCGLLKTGRWEKTYELSPFGSMKCEECIKKEEKQKENVTRRRQ